MVGVPARTGWLRRCSCGFRCLAERYYPFRPPMLAHNSHACSHYPQVLLLVTIASACAPLVWLGLVQFGLVFTTLHPGLRRCCQVVNLPDDTYALALRALDGTFSAKQQTNCAVDFNLWTSPFATSRAKHAQVFNTAKKWVGRGGALSRACTAVSRCVPPPAPVSPTDGATACLCSIIPCSIAAAARALSFRQRCPCWREL